MGDEKKLADVAAKSENTAKELEAEVRYITNMHQKGSLQKAFRAIFRASHHKKKIGRLELLLDRHKQVMETELMSYLWYIQNLSITMSSSNE